MDSIRLKNALKAGYERIRAWAAFLDEINVFPVADGDTGRNLQTSLAPFMLADEMSTQTLTRRLLIGARGNSGNIAARFFEGFLSASEPETFRITKAVTDGRRLAYEAVAKPKAGTMLSFFDALAEAFANEFESSEEGVGALIDELEAAVLQTPEALPILKEAGVVDAGALGLFCFFERFFAVFYAYKIPTRTIHDFRPKTDTKAIAAKTQGQDGYCLDIAMTLDERQSGFDFNALGKSVVATKSGDIVKLHVHASSEDEIKNALEAKGEILSWAADDIERQKAAFGKRGKRPLLQVVTDAAGSVTRATADALSLRLLDSYLHIGDECLPETMVSPEALYAAMRAGVSVKTTQASNYEREEHYENILAQDGDALYLAVGSAYTGNVDAARQWKEKSDKDDRFTLIDTGAASGRLGLAAIATARFALEAKAKEHVIRFAEAAIESTKEWIFLHLLSYLARAGRLSKTSAFFGDLFHVKPIISPLAAGAEKIGSVRNRKEQITYAQSRANETLSKDEGSLVLLEYSDNRPFVEEEIAPWFAKTHPNAEIILTPFSLTSGAYMGPDTWAIAILPKFDSLMETYLSE